MADNLTKEDRHYNMTQIKSADTKPEEIVRKFLFSKGFRYRKNDKRFPGKPDIILPKYRTAVFVHGCFWHCHEGCSSFVLPKSNPDYWHPKLEKNRKRDIEHGLMLIEMGWRIVIVWECELKKHCREFRLEKLINEIKGM